MDDIVLQAMMRWPNVPSVYGWLKLDQRGRWLIKGDPVTNPVLSAFIGRNYLSSDQGQWYFQNGPQQVFVELEYAPFVHHIWERADGALMGETHTGLSINQPTQCWLDNIGNALIECEHGVGCVDTMSLETLVKLLSDEAGKPLSDDTIEALLNGDDRIARQSCLRWNQKLLPLGFITSTAVPERFGFDRSPQSPPGQPPC